MSRRKYLFFITSLSGGGAERVMATIANRICATDDVRILTITSPECFYSLDERITVEGFNNNISRKNNLTVFVSEAIGAIRTLKKLSQYIKAWQPDVILSFLNHPNVLVTILRMLGKLKCKLVLSERSDPNKRNRLSVWFERYMFPKADVIVCQSEQVANFFAEKDRNKTVVIKNPICSAAIPKRFTGVPEKRIVGVGRLFAQKRFDLLIEAFRLLGASYKSYVLEIYGEGPLRESLQKQIYDSGLNERVKLMGQRKNVMHLIADASLFVLASDFEGLPNVIIEAMATGLPIVTTDFTPKGVASELVGTENGMIVSTGNAGELANAIKNILSQPELQQKMRVENRKLLNELNEKEIVAKWNEVLQ